MYTTTHLILILVLLTSLVQCPGGSGGGRGSSGRSNRGSSRSSGRGSTLCFSIECGPLELLFSLFVVIVLMGVLVCLVMACCYQCTSGKPSQVNEDFIRQGSLNYHDYEKYPFETGIWSFRYYQYDKWHGPYRVSLTFDRSLGKVTGQGTDDVGIFTIDGIFSSENFRLALTQIYEAETGDPTENLGHTSTIQLTWNSNNNQFEGTCRSKPGLPSVPLSSEDEMALVANGGLISTITSSEKSIRKTSQSIGIACREKGLLHLN
ncbi:unnamed protein product [Rotaria sp. Silwood2]|nr:unnamed protein product [Rotaria sp. Silwood2]